MIWGKSSLRMLFGMLSVAGTAVFHQGYAEEYAMDVKIFSESLMKQPENAIPILNQKIAIYAPLQQKVLSLKSYDEKLEFISKQSNVRRFFEQNRELEATLSGMPAEYQYVIKAIVSLDQGSVVFGGWQQNKAPKLAMKQLIESLTASERFYDYMGGIVGYHVRTLELIRDSLAKAPDRDRAEILPPPQVDIRDMNPAVCKMVIDGIQSQDALAEVYVVGGAGDRLKLVDEKTKEPLPVAKLDFAGISLIEQLVRNLEAREYLHYKVTGKQIFTPILLMTSLEKNNDKHIGAICEEYGYFGRPKESIFRLLQPLTPVICIDGNWAVSGAFELILKPGGHGVVWKLASEYGAFEWLKKQGKSFCLVRQINNPLAGLDYNLVALAGFGYANKKAFGFESVPRKTGMSEGMNVLRETKNGSAIIGSISNLEYTEFAKRKEHDPAFTRISESGDFPANTNILFANIEAVKQASSKLPVPGYLVNMKHPVDTILEGQKVTLPGARLESTMQNIADCITDAISQDPSVQDLRTFVLVNSRAKTMSVTKKAFDGKAVQETPEGCFYDLLQENLCMLQKVCQFETPKLNAIDEYVKHGPNAIFLYHPALGPLYSIIGQKITKGRLAEGAELQIEAAMVAIKNLDVDGSLLIKANNVTGAKNKSTGLLDFASGVGSITLENVKVKNAGIERSVSNSYVKNRIRRKEVCEIVLEGRSELIAKDVTFTSNYKIVVPDGKRALISQKPNGEIVCTMEKLDRPMNWLYKVNKNNEIILQK